MTKHLSDSFLCWYCEKNLTDNRYVIKDGFAVCLSCFEERYANYCATCHQIIAIETPGCVFQEHTWHNTCFNCSLCRTSLINKKFAFRNEKLFCRPCFIVEFAERCYRCNRPLEPGNQCTEYENNVYHKSCFVCHGCQQPLINGDFRRRDQYFLCLACHMRLVAIYCIKCHKAIVNDGVLYHNHPFHNECFLCTHCSMPLRNQRYAEHKGDAYCSVCSSNLFSHRTN